MVGTRLALGDAEFRAEEGAANLGDQFLGGIGGVPEALPEFTSETLVGAGPMGLMPISA